MEVSDERVVELVMRNDVRRAAAELAYARDLIWVINLALATEEMYGRGQDVINMLLNELAKIEVRAILSIGGSMVATSLKQRTTPLLESLKEAIFQIVYASGTARRVVLADEEIDKFKTKLSIMINPYIITPGSA
jgi:citrate lyase alpha subunit